MEYITLNNGIKIPQLGLGTYLLKPDDAQSSVTSALGMGYELIDTANAYVNERAVGRGVRESDLPRENVFLETKLWPYFYNSDTAVDETLERLNTPYIDLMILHQPAGDYLTGYEKLETAYKEGKLRSIGISNFDENEIKKLLANCEIVPSLIQVECHPYFPQTELKKLLAQHDIALAGVVPARRARQQQHHGRARRARPRCQVWQNACSNHYALAYPRGKYRHSRLQESDAHRRQHRCLRLRAHR